MKRILYSQPDGTVAIIIPAVAVEDAIKDVPDTIEYIPTGKYYTEYEDGVPYPTGTAPEIMQEVNRGKIFEIVDTASIPTDRTFRSAWKHDTTKAPEKIKVHLPTAKLIAHDTRRLDRAAALQPLDMMATYDLATAEPQRQAIRDADAIKQKAIDAATTVGEL